MVTEAKKCHRHQSCPIFIYFTLRPRIGCSLSISDVVALSLIHVLFPYSFPILPLVPSTYTIKYLSFWECEKFADETVQGLELRRASVSSNADGVLFKDIQLKLQSVQQYEAAKN